MFLNILNNTLRQTKWRCNNNQRIRHGIKSQDLEEVVVEKNVITLAKSISVLQNASYNYNSGVAKNGLATTINKHMRLNQNEIKW